MSAFLSRLKFKILLSVLLNTQETVLAPELRCTRTGKQTDRRRVGFYFQWQKFDDVTYIYTGVYAYMGGLVRTCSPPRSGREVEKLVRIVCSCVASGRSVCHRVPVKVVSARGIQFTHMVACVCNTPVSMFKIVFFIFQQSAISPDRAADGVRGRRGYSNNVHAARTSSANSVTFKGKKIICDRFESVIGCNDTRGNRRRCSHVTD